MLRKARPVKPTRRMIEYDTLWLKPSAGTRPSFGQAGLS
jgi:hypothetical protein